MTDSDAIILYWHCATCGLHEEAHPPYNHGDSEPCVECENGTARVMTIEEAASIEQQHALSTPSDIGQPVQSPTPTEKT